MDKDAMEQVIARLEKEGYNLSSFHALELFAREGDWHTTAYADRVKSLDAWEVELAFKEGLARNVPQAEIKIVDSIQEIKNPAHRGKYEFIVADNPQGCYGLNNQYCEHFDVIPQACELLGDQGILIFNVNTQPYNFDKFPEWQKRRREYYRIDDASKLSLAFLLDFYEKMFQEKGYAAEFSFSLPRGGYDNTGLHYLYYYYLVYALSRHKH